MSTEEKQDKQDLIESAVQATVGQVLKVVDRGAKKDDRWWFFMLLILGMTYVGYERWENNVERAGLRAEIEQVRSSYEHHLEATAQTLTSALTQNTEMLHRVEQHLAK